MIITKFYLPFDNEDGLEEVSRYSNLTAFLHELKCIIEFDGWNSIHPSVKGVLNRHPLLFQMLIGEMPDSIRINSLEL